MAAHTAVDHVVEQEFGFRQFSIFQCFQGLQIGLGVHPVSGRGGFFRFGRLCGQYLVLVQRDLRLLAALDGFIHTVGFLVHGGHEQGELAVAVGVDGGFDDLYIIRAEGRLLGFFFTASGGEIGKGCYSSKQSEMAGSDHGVLVFQLLKVQFLLFMPNSSASCLRPNGELKNISYEKSHFWIVYRFIVGVRLQ